MEIGSDPIEPVPPPVESDGSALTVTLVRTGGTLGVVAVGGDRSRPASESPCTYRVVEIPLVTAIDVIGMPPSEESVPYTLYCGTARIDEIWITPADIVDYDAIARAEADRYVQTVLAPALTIHHAPATYAVTGAPSHHWIDGWDGQPITVGPINPYGQALSITLTLDAVTWDFGDTTATQAGDLGTPAPSTVRHTYTHRSTSADPDGTYTTTATVTIGATYTLDAGPPTTITPPLTVAPTAPVTVRELQAVLD